ncbi:MAG: D-glycero-beta-D-manno-heptose-7-phosphate kinase [Elusimicrobia bacterium HGW-Elusimicrobia-1]|jgi:D-beta-D-heptose 7-phosphate kinase/D-beta-D-heptose 1-phosphate adenosyltransferase|nr:MAG: D-glycero-beta-D-manno-heptose-7-phosphate kinase [Elusimicrobia bacterium HGW-Elusimicrobia-1]
MKKLIRRVRDMRGKKIIVVGDVMADAFIYGKVTRISPEAPVPVVEVTGEKYMPGGAANVASNIVAVGGRAVILGSVGADTAGRRLSVTLKERGIDVSRMISDDSRPTIMKTRVIAHHQQVVRFDREIKGDPSPAVLSRLIDGFKSVASAADAVIISDYGKGVINRRMLDTVIPYCLSRKIPITVDPKVEHFLDYKKVTCLTPNLYEAADGMKAKLPSSESAVRALGSSIMKALRCRTLIITRGEKGMTLFDEGGKITDMPTRAKEIFDVTGAGDTVISVFTLALAAGSCFSDAAELANYAAGIVVGKLGTATVSADELTEALS